MAEPPTMGQMTVIGSYRLLQRVFGGRVEGPSGNPARLGFQLQWARAASTAVQRPFAVLQVVRSVRLVPGRSALNRALWVRVRRGCVELADHPVDDIDPWAPITQGAEVLQQRQGERGQQLDVGAGWQFASVNSAG